MKSVTHYFIFVMLFSIPNSTLSTHIVGGTATYTAKGIDDNGIANVEFYFNLYRDGNSPAQFDDSIRIGIYGYTDGEYEFIAAEDVKLLIDENIYFNDSEVCIFEELNYQFGLYGLNAKFPVGDYEYYTIAYQRCCRDISITNVLFPSETGIAISMDIYPIALEEISQVFSFKNEFPVHVEPGKKTDFDVSIGGLFAKEYYLSAPKTAGGLLGSTGQGDPNECKGIIPDPMYCLPDFEEVQYIDPENPYGEGAILELDKTSGILSVTIPQSGKILMGMTLERYIDDQIVSRLRQQFVMNVFQCATSTNDEANDPSFVSWPIPTIDNLYLSNPLEQISIYNVDGQKQLIKQKSNFLSQIRIDDFPSGIYFMKGKTLEGKWISQKIVKL